MPKESFFRDAVTELALVQAQRLVDFLNTADTAAPSMEVGRALQIFELCQQLEDHLRALRKSAMDGRTHALLHLINAHLEEFPFLAVLGPWQSHLFVWWRRAPDRHPQRDVRPLGAKRLKEMSSCAFHLDMIRLILTMTEAGTVGRIRECICGKWFFAQTNKKRVCSDACRFQKFSREHANYMRSHRKAKAVLKNSKTRNADKR
jgi:hypothetical protein